MEESGAGRQTVKSKILPWMLGCMDTPKEYVTTKCLTFVIRLQSLRSCLQYSGTSLRGTHRSSCSNVRIQTRGIEHYAPIWYNSVGLRKLILTKWTQGLMDQVSGMITHETRISCGFVTNIHVVGDLVNGRDDPIQCASGVRGTPTEVDRS